MNFKKILASLLIVASLSTTLAGCGEKQNISPTPTDEQTDEANQTDENVTENTDNNENTEDAVIPAVELKNLGESLEAAGINNGKFDGDTTNTDFTVTYISGTESAYAYDDAKKTLTFSALSADSKYSISGKLNGNIIIDVGEGYALELELAGLAIRSSNATPILINSGKEVKISAKKDTKSYIFDERAAIDGSDSKNYNGAIHSLTDLTLCGAGELFVQSLNNNGIRSNTDVTVKELSLVVECNDRAINGRNNVTLERCSTLLVAKSGDAIKTEASNLTEFTAKQNGTVRILGGTHNIFASNDGIEAAYDVFIDNATYTDENTKEEKAIAAVLNIYTDKYSSYTSSNAHGKPDVETKVLYVCHTNKDYKYSVKLFNADQTKSEWINPVYYESVKSGRRTYYTHKFFAKPEYTKMQVFVYSKDQAQQNEETYTAKSNVTDIKADADAYRCSNNRSWEWKTYASLTQQGSGNTNPNALPYSAKGIRGTNAITVKAGSIKISASDNAISADNQTILDNGRTPTGEITVSNGNIVINTKCNGLNSGGALTVSGGNIKILEAFEGIKGETVTVTDGDISVKSTSDGLSAKAKTGTGITIEGGKIFVYSDAYGIKSSSTSSYTAIAFKGGDIVIIAPEAKKSAIYSEGGYTYTNGRIFAILNKEGNRNSTTHYYSFSQVGKIQELELAENTYATVEIDGEAVVAAKLPKAFSAIAVYIGDKSVNISSTEQIDGEIDTNGIYWAD